MSISKWCQPLTFQKPIDLAKWAKKYLSCVVPMVKKPAVVFDIDGTLLKGESERLSKRNPAVAAVYEWCTKHEIDCFIVTARMETLPGVKMPVNVKTKTERELIKLGFTRYKEVFMFPESVAKRCRNDPAPFKRSVRNHIRSMGYQIILNLGDMWTDHTVEKSDGDRVCKFVKSIDSKRSYCAFPSFDNTMCPIEMGVKLPEE
jgi:predicted secreted acid phosphatase